MTVGEFLEDDHMAARKKSRKLDWGCAIMILAWGVTLLLPGNTFGFWQSELLDRLSEPIWGILCVTVGVVRAGALIINGRLHEGSPAVRAGATVLSFFVWGQFAVAFVTVSYFTGVVSLGVPVALVMAGLDLFCAVQAGSDTIHARRARDHQ